MDVFKIPLRIQPEERKTVTASFDDSICLIKIPVTLFRQRKQSIGYIDRVYWKMLAHIYEPELKERTEELNSTYYNFKYNLARYHRQFRRWGSCSSLRNINISHRLIGAPQVLVDYVILHELAHLKYLDHRRDFWNLVRQTGFDPRVCRKNIQDYGSGWDSSYIKWLKDIKLYMSQ